MNVRRSVKERKNRPAIIGVQVSRSVSVIVVAGVVWFDETQVALGVDEVKNGDTQSLVSIVWSQSKPETDVQASLVPRP
jgi:hypothetical protein